MRIIACLLTRAIGFVVVISLISANQPILKNDPKRRVNAISKD